MSNSVQTVVSDGSLTLLDISFNYFDRTHVHVYFDNVEQTLGTTWSWVGSTDKKIQFSPAVADDVVVKVQRITPLENPRHVYSSPGNAPFNKSTVDENFRQTLYAAQEAQEGASLTQLQQDLDAQGNKITDLGDALLDGDAVNLKVLREYLPYGPAAASLNARILAEEQATLVLSGPYGTASVGRASYTDLRNYSGSATRLTLEDGGTVVRTGTQADNGGTSWRDGLNRSWVRVYSGAADVRWFGAVCDGVTDDTAKVQLALNSGSAKVIVPAGCTVGVTTLTMAENQTLQIDGAVKKLSGTSPIILMANGCRVIGTGTIDGNSVACDGIVASGKTDLLVDGLYLHHVGGKGIAFYASCTKYKITRNRLDSITGAAIGVEYSSGGVIYGNSIDTAHDGILFYGGDANLSTTIGSTGIVISDNVIKNIVWGGIWGTLTSHVTVTNNFVENCADVGIDFEGCLSFSCTGNTAKECANGCFAVFFGSKVGTFSGNTAYNEVSAGAGFYATTNTSYQNERISIVGNSFRTNAGRCIYIEPRGNLALSNSLIAGNSLVCVGGSSGVYGAESSGLVISGNQITTVGSAIGIYADGVSASIIEGNFLSGINDTNSNPANGGGITLKYRSAAYPAQSNVVRDNRVDSFVYSIVDACTPDVTKSNNYIANNHVANVYRAAGASYTGLVELNRDTYSPTTPVSPSTF